MAADLNAQWLQEQFGHCARRNTRGRFTGGSSLQNIARIGEIVLERARKVGVAGPRGSYGFVLFRVTCSYRQSLGPVFPIAIFDPDGNRRADGLAMADPGEEVGPVLLDAHAAATAEALLPPHVRLAYDGLEITVGDPR